MYLISHTQDCQQYNKHKLITDKNIAEEHFKKMVTNFKAANVIAEIYSENDEEFYCMTNSNTQDRIYIQELAPEKKTINTLVSFEGNKNQINNLMLLIEAGDNDLPTLL